MKHGFGIIGCGMIGRFHAAAIQSLAEARLVACCSRSFDSANKFAEEFDCEPTDRLESLLGRDDLSIVTIGTPSGAHREPAVASAEHGKHVLVEKPLEITGQRCEQIIAACQQYGVKLGTIFQSRFHAVAAQVKQALDAGRFGRLVLGNAYVKWFRSQEYYDSGAWRGTYALDGGGALMNQAIHSVDLLQWFMGPVSEVAARTATLAHERIEVEDAAVASLRFANGALGSIEATTAAWPGSLKRIEIYGTHGTAIIEEEDLAVWQFQTELAEDDDIRNKFAARTSSGGGAADPAAISWAGHAACFQDFIEAIGEDRQPLIGGAEGRKSVEIIEAVYRANQSGAVVNLSTA